MADGERMGGEFRVVIRTDADVASARRYCRVLAAEQGLSHAAAEALATATSEIAQNILVHAWAGEILVKPAVNGSRKAVVVIARDDGPGISDTAQALRDGFSTARGLGLGLPSARRLVDEFELVSTPGEGTTVSLKKWA
jgi:serine/threonine-protein kinase RsbT